MSRNICLQIFRLFFSVYELNYTMKNILFYPQLMYQNIKFNSEYVRFLPFFTGVLDVINHFDKK